MVEAVLELVLGAFLLLAMPISSWVILSKRGQPGCFCLIPIVNLFALVAAAGLPWYWAAFMFIPGLNIVAYINLHLALASSFNRGLLFAIGLMLFPWAFYPLLAFTEPDSPTSRNATLIMSILAVLLTASVIYQAVTSPTPVPTVAPSEGPTSVGDMFLQEAREDSRRGRDHDAQIKAQLDLDAYTRTKAATPQQRVAARELLAHSLEKQGRRKEALAHYKMLRAAVPKNPAYAEAVKRLSAR